MSCKVNTEITGGYGDGEENNESLNPEDLEQSVIMEMQDDNDRYKLYKHKYLSKFIFLTLLFSTEFLPQIQIF